MQLVKANKKNSKWKFIFPLFILIIVGVIIFLLNKKSDSPIVVCNMSEEKYNEKLNERVEEDFIIEDYFYYGDNLNLKHKAYLHGKSDETNQKTVILKNLCNNEEKSVIIEQFIDRQIDLSKLDAGIYKVMLSENLVRKNVTTKLNLIEFNTLTKNGKHKKISYIKNNKDDLHIKVEEVESDANKVDIIVDTIYNHEDLLLALDRGYLDANTISFKQAQNLVQLLNDNGYRAQLARKDNEIKNVYGENGRIHDLYQNNIKYYFTLGIEHSNVKSIQGIYLEGSYLASKNISNSIMYKIISNSDTQISSIHHVNEYGVIRNEIFQGDDGEYYDGNLYIREAGGYATGAGRFSANSAKNASFAKENKYGIYGLYLSLGFQTNEEDLNRLNSNQILELFVEGFKAQR